MKIIFSLILVFFAMSCAQKSIKNRSVSSEPTMISYDPSQEEMLPLPPSSCPPDTQLQSGVVEIQIQKCLKNYIHEKTAHGVTRSRVCFPPETKHEARLRIPPPSRIYVALLKKIYFPYDEVGARVVLKMNQAYYSVEWEGPSSVPAKVVKEKIKNTPFPKKVSLERCECDISKFSNEECLRKLSPIIEAEETYFVNSPQLGV